MAEDNEVLRQIWSSYLPIHFTLAHNEVTGLQEPDPYYVNIYLIYVNNNTCCLGSGLETLLFSARNG